MCAVYNLVVCPICGILRVKSWEGEQDSPCYRCETEDERGECPVCKGRGTAYRSDLEGGPFHPADTVDCPACEGRGWV